MEIVRVREGSTEPAATTTGRRVARRPRRAVLVAWDAAAVPVAFAATKPGADRGFTPVEFGLPVGEAAGPLSPSALLFTAVALIGLSLTRERDAGLGGRWALLFRLVVVSAVSTWTVLVVGDLAAWDLDRRQLVVVSVALPIVWLAGRLVLDVGRRRERVVLLGSGMVAKRITELSRRHPEIKLNVVGWLDDDPRPDEDGGSPHLGSLSALPRLLASGEVDRVIVCFSQARDERVAAAVRACDAENVAIDMVPRMFELVDLAPRSRSIAGFPLVCLASGRSRGADIAAKRVADLVGALVLIVITLPLLLVVAAAVLLGSGRPMLHHSERLGRGGVPFRMLKFRSMVRDAESRPNHNGADIIRGQLKSADDPRVTRVGRVLRRFSLDELPQLFNVVAGQMSLVGPRPVLVSEWAGLEGWAARRHSVRPGMTGLWQVLGRSTIPWEERMQLDYAYARHWSLTFDLRILVSTFVAVVTRRGAF